MSEFHADRVNRLEDRQADQEGRVGALEQLVKITNERLTEEREANAEERRANEALLAEERKANADRLDARLAEERKAYRSERLWMVGIYSVLLSGVVGSFGTLVATTLDLI